MMISEIILVLVYLYPGALVDVFRKRFFKYSFRQDTSSNFEKAARYFGFSVIISTCSLMIYAALFSGGVYSFDAILQSLNGTMNMGAFCLISYVSAFVFTLLIRMADMAIIKAKNIFQKAEDGTTIIDASSVWMEVVRGKIFAPYREHMIARIICNGADRAGFLRFQPDEFCDGLLLVQCKPVANQLKHERDNNLSKDECYIGPPVGVYFDPNSGAIVELYDGREYSEYLGV